jgi:hypothetical protein
MITSNPAFACTAPPDDPDDFYELVVTDLTGKDVAHMKTDFHESICGAQPSLIQINEEMFWYEIKRGIWTEMTITDNGTISQTGRTVDALFEDRSYYVHITEYSYQDSIITEVLYDEVELALSVHKIDPRQQYQSTFSFQNLVGHSFTREYNGTDFLHSYTIEHVNVYVNGNENSNVSSSELLILLNYFNQTDTPSETLQVYSTILIRYNISDGAIQTTLLPDIGYYKAFTINENLDLMAFVTVQSDTYNIIFLNSTLHVVNSIILELGYQFFSFSSEELFYYQSPTNSYISLNPFTLEKSEYLDLEIRGIVINDYIVRYRVYTKDSLSLVGIPMSFIVSIALLSILRFKRRRLLQIS